MSAWVDKMMAIIKRITLKVDPCISRGHRPAYPLSGESEKGYDARMDRDHRLGRPHLEEP